MSELLLSHLRQSHKRHTLALADRYVFLLKQLFALLVAVAIVILLAVSLWLALTHSIYLVLLFFAIIGAGIVIPYLLAMPLLHPHRVQVDCTPSDLDIQHWEAVRFFSIDQVELRGWFIPPDPQTCGATLVFVHGLGSNRGQLLSQATVMIAKGYGALLFDLRNHGASGGTITTLGFTEARDVQAAIGYLLTRPEVDPERIGLVGYSMGGAAVLRAATHLPQIKAIVAESTYTSLEDNIAQGMIAKTGLPPFPFAPIMIWLGEHITGLRMNQIRPIDNVAQIDQPILFVHGAQDKTVDVSNSARLHAIANEPKGLYIVKHAAHSDLLAADPVGFERYVAGFLEHHLRKHALADQPIAV